MPRKASRKKSRKASKKKSRKTSKKNLIAFKRNVKCPKGYVKGIPQDGSKYKTLCIKKSMDNKIKKSIEKIIKKSRKPKRKSRVNKKKSRKASKKKSRKASKKKSRKPKRKSRKPKRKSRVNKKKSRKPKRKSRVNKKKSRKPKRKSRKPKKGRTYKMKSQKSSPKKGSPKKGSPKKSSPKKSSSKKGSPKMKETMGALTKSVVAGSRTKPGVLAKFLGPEEVKNVVLIDKEFYDWFKKKYVKNQQLKQIIKKAENLNIILPPPSLRRHVKLSTGLFPEEVQQKIGGSWIYGTIINDSTYIVHLPFEPYETVKLRINPDYTTTMIHASYNTQF